MAKKKNVEVTINGKTTSEIGQAIKDTLLTPVNKYEERAAALEDGSPVVGQGFIAATNPGYWLGKSVAEGAREHFNPETNNFEFTIGSAQKPASPMSNWWASDIIPDTADPLLAQEAAGIPKQSAMEYALTHEQEEDPYPNGRDWDINGNDGFNDLGLEAYLKLIDEQRSAEGLPALYNGYTNPGNGGGGNGGYGDIPDFVYNPTQYSSKYYDQMDAILRDLNLDKFKFDLNGEELYQQYKDQYLRNGRLAMMDTMGQTAGLTGGYGSTYAQNAGQQAYQGYVNDLNNVVPDVYNAAYTRWRDSISDKLNQYKLLADADNRDYTRWADEENRNYTQAWNEYSQQSKERMAQIDAETTRQKNENDAQLAEKKLMVGNGYHFGSNGQLVPDGYDIDRNGQLSQSINGVFASDIDDTVANVVDYFIDRSGASFPAFVKSMDGINKMLAEIERVTGWDEDQLKYAKRTLAGLVSGL